MSVSAAYYFYLLPEKTYDFMALLMQRFGPHSDSVSWIWPDGRHLSHQEQGATEATPAIPFEDAWRTFPRISILLSENEDVRSYLGLPEPKTAEFWKRRLTRIILPESYTELQHHEIFFDLDFAVDPIRLQWESGQPEYTRVGFVSEFSSLSLFFSMPIFREFVIQLAKAGATSVNGLEYPFLLDNSDVPAKTPPDLLSPHRQREFLPVFNRELHSNSQHSTNPLDRAAFLAHELNFDKRQQSLNIEALHLWMEDESLLVRRLTTWALRFAPVFPGRELLPFLEDASPGIRQLACEAAINTPQEDTEYVSRILELLHDPDPGVRSMAGWGLFYTPYREKSIEILFNDPHHQVRLAAAALKTDLI